MDNSSVLNNRLVLEIYTRLASVYDQLFGRPLQSGRQAALRRLAIRPGDAVLEVGIGTGFGASLYPRYCSVTGVDLSEPMLAKAANRLGQLGIRHVRLARLDAARLPFHDEAFDIVYAPYLMSVVPDPVAVVREMRRVCRVGGRVVLLNHFRSERRIVAWIERSLAPVTVHLGFRPDLDLASILGGSGLEPLAVEAVNVPPLSSLVTCCRVA